MANDPLSSVQSILDTIDDEVDMFEAFPFVGSIAKSVATLLDPVRKAVDSGSLQAVRSTIDQVAASADALAKEPFIGAIAAPVASVLDRIRAMIDPPVPTTTPSPKPPTTTPAPVKK